VARSSAPTRSERDGDHRLLGDDAPGPRPGRAGRLLWTGLARRLRRDGIELDGPHEHDGGDRALYVRDPEGNVVEAWDFFERGRTVRSLRDAAA